MNKEEILKEIFNEAESKIEHADRFDASSEHKVSGNHSGYGYRGSENFEHDNTGDQHNYSGVEDEVYSAFADHEDWSEDYDY